MLAAFFTGLGTGLSLIVAIGAQNAFVLRQGLRGEHVLAVALACALSDAVLIALGVSGFARLLAALPVLDSVLRWAGALFLFIYGGRSLMSAWRGTGALGVAGAAGATALWPTLLTCLALTWLNPHVYLDTMVLIGTISTRFGADAPVFGLGAALASFLFFFALAYGAALLRPIFAAPRAWRVLELVIGLVMWTIAAQLLLAR